MTPINQTLAIIQQKIDKLKKSHHNDEMLVELIEMKESMKALLFTERQNITLAWETGKYSSRYDSGESYFDAIFGT